MASPNYVMRCTAPVTTITQALLRAVGRVPTPGVVVGVRFIADATLTGVTTNTRTQNLYNRTASGVATTVIATRAYINAVNAAVMQDTPLTLSATPANLVVAQGDELQWESVSGGTGIIDPGGMIEVEIQPLSGVSG